MTFNGTENQVLEFKISGYELPENRGPSYEANFLDIELNIKSSDGHWQTDNCALSTTDVEKILAWFHSLKESKTVPGDLRFIEKGISFESIKNTDDQTQFRILLHSECLPKAMKKFDPYPMEFKLNKDALNGIYESLQEELNAFPTRGFEE